MVCKCKNEMRLLFCWDDAQETDHAYNLWACESCGRIVKQDVWEDAGELWINLSGAEQGSD